MHKDDLSSLSPSQTNFGGAAMRNNNKQQQKHSTRSSLSWLAIVSRQYYIVVGRTTMEFPSAVWYIYFSVKWQAKQGTALEADQQQQQNRKHATFDTEPGLIQCSIDFCRSANGRLPPPLCSEMLLLLLCVSALRVFHIHISAVDSIYCCTYIRWRRSREENSEYDDRHTTHIHRCRRHLCCS